MPSILNAALFVIWMQVAFTQTTDPPAVSSTAPPAVSPTVEPSAPTWAPTVEPSAPHTLSPSQSTLSPTEVTPSPTESTPSPTIWAQNCSALHAFVEVTGMSVFGNNTLSSAQALFPPFNYNPIPYTPLVTLPAAELCDETATLSVDVSNTIVLLFEGSSNCTDQYKVFVAEQKGAKAVLLARTVDDTVAGNSSLVFNLSITIPMRTISALAGAELRDELMADGSVEVQFGCFDTVYPTELCVYISDEFSDFAGLYQRQDTLINGHPMWKLDGIAWLREDIYMFLHHGHGEEDWYWAAAYIYGVTFQYDEDMRLRCHVGGSAVSDPSQCGSWDVSNETNANLTDHDWIPFTVDVAAGQCNWTIEAQTLCVDSLQHSLTGAGGTYRALTPGATIWDRDSRDCDHHAGWIEFVDEGKYGTAYFVLMEPYNLWILALCMIPDDQKDADGTYATARWRPDLCTEWKVRNDGDLAYSKFNRYEDPTFNVSLGACSAERQAVLEPPCTYTEPPEVMCLANNSIMHGSAMGQYVKLEAKGKVFDTPIYQRINYTDCTVPLICEPLYIWYVNEVWAPLEGWGDYLHYRAWALTPQTIEEAVERMMYDEWGFCQGWAGGNPFDCKGWLFWADKGEHRWAGWDSTAHYDERMTITDRECNASSSFPPDVPAADEWPQYLCIGFGVVNQSSPWAGDVSSVHEQDLMGAFVLETDGDNKMPQWRKRANDIESREMHIAFDVWWELFAKDERNKTAAPLIWCDALGIGSGSMNPVDCGVWYDKRWDLLNNIYFYECTADDVLTVTFNETISLSRGGTVSSLLEGIYEADGEMELTDGTRLQEFRLNSEYVRGSVFMWYDGGNWWLSPVDYETKTAVLNDVEVYGYCRGGTMGDSIYPECEDCWVLFWELTTLWEVDAPHIKDCSLTVNPWYTAADLEVMYTGDAEYLDSLCVKKLNGDLKNHDHGHGDEEEDLDHAATHPYEKWKDLPEPALRMEDYTGTYAWIEGTGMYTKGKSDDDGPSIRHDRITNNWIVGYSEETPWFLCHGHLTEDGTAFPGECWVYERLDSGETASYFADNVLYIGRCNGKQTMDNGSGGAVAGTVIGIILGLICCGVVIFLVIKCKKEKSHSVVVEETEFAQPVGKTKKEDGDNYDMTALNDEDIDADADGNDPLTA